MKIPKLLLYILIPSLFVAAVGAYFGHLQYIEGLQRAMDESDNFQWAFVAGLLYSPIGLTVGLIMDLFIWLLTNSPKQKMSRKEPF